MSKSAAPRWKSLVGILFLGIVVLLGESRIPIATADAAIDARRSAAPRGAIERAAADARTLPMASGVRESRGLELPDEDVGRLVPAIHARNPATRFVYFRHVSRWM